jgi:hypothetical protein
MRYSLLIALVLSAVAIGSIVAQEPPRVQPGARVRVTAAHLPHGRQIGTLAYIDADTLIVGPTRVAVQSVSKLEVNTGRRSHSLLGAGIGFLIGAGVGAIASSGKNACTNSDYLSPGTACVLVGAGVLGVVGIPVGAIVGALVRTDRWQEIALSRLSVRTFPQSDSSLSLAVSLRF